MSSSGSIWNPLSGVTATSSELNLLDGDTSVGSSITITDNDGFIVNDGGTTKLIPASDVSTYAGGGGGGVSLTNGVDNRVTTATGASALNGEANLTFDGSELIVTGDAEISGRTQANLVVKADNETGGTLSKGTPVYVSATHSSGRPSVSSADADGSGTYPAIGIVWSDISAGTTGYIAQFGVVEDVAAARFVGADPAVGDTVYLSETVGKLTVDRPSASGSQVQNVGRITKTNVSVSGNTGTANVLVQGPGRTNDTPNSISAFDETLTYATSDTNAGTFTVLDINFDKTGASTSNNTMIGINLDMDNTSATGGNNEMVGIKVTPTLTHASGTGTATCKGIEIVATGATATPQQETVRALDIIATGAETNQGIFMKVDNGTGPDIKMVSSANNADSCTIAVGANGETTITTVDGDAALAHLNLTVDGNLVSTAATAVTVQTGATGIAEGVGVGDIIAFGSEDTTDTLAAGKLMYLDSTGTWKYADADAEVSTKSLIAIALGTNISDGLLTKGYFKFASADIEGAFAKGAPCFISEAAGKIDFTSPSAAGDFVRVIGYGTDTTNVVYFNPSGDWIAL